MPDAVTFLFTDIEGSTRLWEREPERMRPALARHDAIARLAVESHRGQVVKMTGDGLHAVFDDPLDAVQATLALQRSLAESAAPDAMALKVRCGLHAGAVPERRDNDFFGAVVNRAARIMSAAHGGQVLVSRAIAERIRERLPGDVALRDLGAVRLRDLASPEHIYQVLHPALPAEFPALRSLEDTPNNLAQPVSSFVGRDRELADVGALLRANRLVTIVGMGGLGKTRLSLHVAADALEEHPDGVWMVELAPVHEPSRIAQVVASTLGVRAEPGRPLEEALARHVAGRSVLIVLDNCEHLVEGSATMARHLLSSGAGVRVLATSREPLRIAGEATFLLGGLAVPGPRTAVEPAAVLSYESVRLFVERAAAAQPGFDLTPDNASAVAAICHRVDGIPLAIELAAARVRSISVREIATRLKDRFRLLTSGDPTVSPRQRTLRALIDWSHALLPEDERALFRQLSAFAGGWTLQAAEEVCLVQGADRDGVLDLLSRLVEKSLIVTDHVASRYSMLETVRQYALEQLDGSGEGPGVRLRHLAHYLAFAESAQPHLSGSEQGDWLRRLDLERENLLAAHEYAGHSAQTAAAGLRLVNAIKLYFANRGLLELGLRLVIEALGREGAGKPDLSRCRALFNAGQFRYFMGRYAEARSCLEESLAIARILGDPAAVARVLQPLGMAAIGQGDLSQAGTWLDEAVSITREIDDRRSLSGALNARAMLHRVEGRLRDARPLYEQVVKLSLETENREVECVGLLNLSMIAIEEADGEAARRLVEQALGLAVEIASAPAGQSAMEVCAGLAAHRGDWAAAARFFGAAEAIAERTGARRDAADEAFLAPKMALARARLGEGAFAAQADGGRLQSMESALGAAREWLAGTPVAA